MGGWDKGGGLQTGGGGRVEEKRGLHTEQRDRRRRRKRRLKQTPVKPTSPEAPTVVEIMCDISRSPGRSVPHCSQMSVHSQIT